MTKCMIVVNTAKIKFRAIPIDIKIVWFKINVERAPFSNFEGKFIGLGEETVR